MLALQTGHRARDRRQLLLARQFGLRDTHASLVPNSSRREDHRWAEREGEAHEGVLPEPSAPAPVSIERLDSLRLQSAVDVALAH